MVDSVDWAARRRVLLVKVDSFDVTFRKRGMGNLNDVVWSTPGLGEIIEALVEAVLGETDPEKRKAAIETALKSALKSVASAGGQTPGRVAIQAAKSAIPTLLDIIAEDTVLATEEERVPYREWLATLGPRGLLDAISGWIKLNLPEAHGPFVRWVATALFKGKAVLDAMETRLTPSEMPSETPPAPSETSISAETVSIPTAA